MAEGQYDSAAKRWAGVGPYYAMFPTTFADTVVKKHTQRGDTVLDPFAGRGTAVFSAAVQGRIGIGIELNPVGWVYARTKLSPATQEEVEARIRGLGNMKHAFGLEAVMLPEFFRRCYCVDVRQYLLAARANLDWRRNHVDRTTMALLLVYLHGKAGSALSNQMRQAKAMSPEYAVRWWNEREMTPPVLEPVEFLVRRLKWRYAKGRFVVRGSKMYLDDSVRRLPELGVRVKEGRLGRASMLLTSPPYYGITNYFYDQWLRLWLLGGPPNALRDPGAGAHKAKFEHYENYKILLTKVFESSSELLTRNAVVYVRTDRREETFEPTKAILRLVFPKKRLTVVPRPFKRPTQTRLFGDKSEKVGEVDLILKAV